MKSYCKVVRQAIVLHLLDHYEERGKRGIIQDFNAVRLNHESDLESAKHLVEGGCFLIYYGDQRDFLNSLKINDGKKQYTNQQVFDKYVALLSREIIKIVQEDRARNGLIVH